jgi:hypothetical protein
MVVQPQTAVGPSGDESEIRKRIDELVALEAQLDESKLLDPWRGTCHEIAETLPARLEQARSHGYAYLASVEESLADLGQRAQRVGRVLEESVLSRGRALFWRLADARQRLELHPSSSAHEPAWLARCDDALAEFRREVAGLQQEVERDIGDLPVKSQTIAARLTAIDQTLRKTAEASFAIDRAREAVFVAVDAEWKKGKSARENPDGVLFVTDRRIVMERKEKEGGFLGMGGRKVQEVLWELPLDQVETIAPEKRGLMGGVDLIHIRPKPGAPFELRTVEVKGHVDAHQFAASLHPALDGTLATWKRTG